MTVHVCVHVTNPGPGYKTKYNIIVGGGGGTNEEYNNYYYYIIQTLACASC